jgi:hypothetical protein
MGNRREKVEKVISEEEGREYIDVRGSDLWMEGTRSARKIFELGTRSGQRNARLRSAGRVQEEQAESESGKESGKV